MFKKKNHKSNVEGAGKEQPGQVVQPQNGTVNDISSLKDESVMSSSDDANGKLNTTEVILADDPQEEETDNRNVTTHQEEEVKNDDADVAQKDEAQTDNDKVRFDEDGKLDLDKLFKVFKKYWWMFLLNCLIFGAIAALLIIEEPRTYTTDVCLAPEAEYAPAGGGLSSIASSFGIDIGSVTSSDAIRPDLYPDLVSSSDFILDLFKLPVKTIDGNVYTDYYTYLKKYQRTSWWKSKIHKFMLKFKDKPMDRQEITYEKSGGKNTNSQIQLLSYDQEQMIEVLRGLINCSVDKQTYTINISVTDQDPLICATVADSVRLKIQNFITDYRTRKASNDYDYYYKLLRQAKTEYEASCKEYAKYVDSHRDVILQSYISERDQLENDMQLKLNTYNAMLTQAQNAKAKIQEKTPVFTVLQNATVPVKPTGPKRMMFVFGIVFMTFLITAVFVVVRS